MIFLNWDDPKDDGGSDLTGFVVERKDIKKDIWKQPVETIASKCECTGIVEGQEYIFRVMAKNKYGLGTPVELPPILAVDAPSESQKILDFDSENKQTKTSVFGCSMISGLC